MYGLTRATLTLIGVALAGVLLWLATAILPSTVSDASRGEYWAAYGLVALAGLAMALSQLLGGWTKWGWPRVSGNVFLLAFLPTLIAGGWILAGHEPESYSLGRHVRGWSSDIGVVPHVLEGDAERIVEEFQEELDSARFDARRLDLD